MLVHPDRGPAIHPETSARGHEVSGLPKPVEFRQGAGEARKHALPGKDPLRSQARCRTVGPVDQGVVAARIQDPDERYARREVLAGLSEQLGGGIVQRHDLHSQIRWNPEMAGRLQLLYREALHPNERHVRLAHPIGFVRKALITALRIQHPTAAV